MRNKGIIVAAWLSLFAGFALPASAQSRPWKKATTPEDAAKFLGGQAPYQGRPLNPDVKMVQKSGKPVFIISYDRLGSGSGRIWSHHKFYSASSVTGFLDKFHALGLRIAASRKFPQSKWGWKKAANRDDMIRFIEGCHPYTKPRRKVAVAATSRETIVFYAD